MNVRRLSKNARFGKSNSDEISYKEQASMEFMHDSDIFMIKQGDEDFEEHKSSSEANSESDDACYNLEEEGEIFMDASEQIIRTDQKTSVF